MYRVLVPVDTDVGRSLHQAQYVARLAAVAGDVEATVLHVAPEWTDRHFSKVEAATDAAEYLADEGVAVRRVLEKGHVAREILDAAAAADSHEIVMGGRKRSGVAMVVLGSTVRDVMLSAERPVTVTGRSRVSRQATYRLLVPVDEDEARARDQAAYVTGLPNAPEAAEVTVLYVQDSADRDEFAENDAAVAAADAIARAGIAVDRVAAAGRISRRIVGHALERRADDVVMGGRKRSGIQNVLLGSTTQDVLLSDLHPVTIAGSGPGGSGS
ncbi:MAG: universal stress protein [Haloferacaceae archaeon]